MARDTPFFDRGRDGRVGARLFFGGCVEAGPNGRVTRLVGACVDPYADNWTSAYGAVAKLCTAVFDGSGPKGAVGPGG